MTHDDSLPKPATAPQPMTFNAHPSSPKIRFRSKHGAPLDTNVVPGKTPVTASAITPTPRPMGIKEASPSAAFMTTLPGQTRQEKPPLGDATAAPFFADQAAKENRLEDTVIPGALYGGSASPQRLTASSKRGMVVAGMIVCGMLIGLTGIWWADQPHSHQARADRLAPAPENAFPTSNASAFSAAGYSPGATGYSGDPSTARAEGVTPPVSMMKKPTRKQPALAQEEEQANLYAAIAKEEETVPAATPNPSPAPAKATPAKPRRAKPASKTQRNLQALRTCSRGANLFEREKCKWKVCGDSWGKNGCPAYN